MTDWKIAFYELLDFLGVSSKEINLEDAEAFIEFLKEVKRSSGTLYLVGAGRSLEVLSFVGHRLRQIPISMKVHSWEESFSPMIKDDDALLVLTGTGETKRVHAILDDWRDFKNENIALISSKIAVPEKSEIFSIIQPKVQILFPGITKEDIDWKRKNQGRIYPTLFDLFTNRVPGPTKFEIFSLLFLESVVSELFNVYKSDEPEPPQLDKEKYTIGVVTALLEEYTVFNHMLNNKFSQWVKGENDEPTQYILGTIPTQNGGVHNVVHTRCYKGNVRSTAETMLLCTNFPNVKHIIIVGIGGGFPRPDKPSDHVRLGDIVVVNEQGVCQYMVGKDQQNGFTRTPPPRPPSSFLCRIADTLLSEELRGNRPWLQYINTGMDTLRIKRPPKTKDILYDAQNSTIEILHPTDPARHSWIPRLFKGAIGSAPFLLKNPELRDELGKQFDLKANDMDSAGVAEACHRLGKEYYIVRGISDYCDNHKNDRWKMWAALVSTAFTRSLIEAIPVI